MHLRRLVPLAWLGALLALSQPGLVPLAFAQPGDSADLATADLASANQATADLATADQATSAQAQADQAQADQAPADQAPADQASPDQAPPDQASPDQAPADQAIPDQAPADQAPPDQVQPDQVPAADDAHWWLKRGGPQDFGTVFPLQNDYRTFWQFRSQAFANLDTVFLPEVMVGRALTEDQVALQQFKAEGKAQIVVVENHPQIWYASPDEAVIYDPYVSRSYFVNAKTRAPLGDGPNSAPSTSSIAYHLTMHPDVFGSLVWKVDDAVQIVN